MELFQTSIPLILKTLVLSASWTGQIRLLKLQNLAKKNNQEAEVIFLQKVIYRLRIENDILRKQVKQSNKKPRYTLKERLQVIWYLEYFHIPHRQVKKHFGIARSTLYRWLNDINKTGKQNHEAHNRTPMDLTELVWEIAKANPHWGRIRIAFQIALFNVFISASTVRNIRNRPGNPPKKKGTDKISEPNVSHSIVAHYPNHVWSVDLTNVKLWGLWPTFVLVGIDHYSRKLVCCSPLEGPNSGWTIDALEQSIQIHGTPKHIISDQELVFTSEAFAELMNRHQIKLRFGAVGKHGSIAVTERVIKTLKHEWMNRVTFIKGFDHLEDLCHSFQEWYNEWRPHYRLEGRTPNQVFNLIQQNIPDRKSKVVSYPIEQRQFKEINTTAFRLKKAA